MARHAFCRLVIAGVVTVSGFIGLAQAAPNVAVTNRIDICHGYSCAFRSRLDLGPNDAKRFASILASGKASPQAERAAIAKAVSYFETRSQQVTGVRDQPKSEFGASKVRGQMDCVDESTNTNSLLRYLEARGLLKYHKVEAKTSRGFLLDGRYPHWTAVIRAPDGVKWVVDSWYAPMGGAPDIIPLSDWKVRGVLESGALD
ncbi:hypothetical protein [Aminobacter sp. AP02]|uniref:hypothetical protein n=1 Tax=Aminobacter sp. AP02 TaxID=2135737 RepID=UPI000D7A41AD|nr:hypothetical protein [Aminobacter sp. AP02]PWK65931.1 hypothetical protein C8K44_115148 [Aminobacter sp. AP02]